MVFKKQSATFSKEEWYGLHLKGQPLIQPVEELAASLLCLRFEFSRPSIGEAFIASVHQALCQLPPIVLQALQAKQIQIQLDFVSEIPAVMVHELRQLQLSKHFVLDRVVYDTAENPVYPYGLSGILMHESAHFLDYALQSGVQLSQLATFNNAFEKDVAAIPKAHHMSHEARVAACEEYGGYLNLPPDLRLNADLALFSLQKEETFADAVAFLALGKARPVVVEYFPETVKATEYLMGHYFRLVGAAKT